MKFAQIVFDDQHDKCRIRPIEDIQFHRRDKTCIKPESDKDFVQGHKYYVKYYDCGIDGDACRKIKHNHYFEYLGAYIYELGSKWTFFNNFINACL